MGLGSVPKSDPMHDAQTLLHRSLGVDSDDYRAIPLSQIVLNPQNDYAGNDTEEEIRELASDIERNGLLHNIVVSDRTRDGGGYMILSGERRYKAVRLLFEEKKENKYAVITSKVLSGLDPLDEMLVLDAANLQTRGGMQDEKRFRKATLRFIDNLRAKGGVSERDAVSLATKYTGVSKKLIDKNLSVEQNLHPAILDLLDRDLIPKNQAVQYAELPEATQEMLANTLLAAYEGGNAALRDANDRLAVATKKIAALSAQAESGERGMREVDEEISNAQLSLAALHSMAENAASDGESGDALAGQIDAVKKTLSALETQKKLYVNTIAGARAAIKKSEETLLRIGGEVRGVGYAAQTETKASETDTAPVEKGAPNGNALRDDIAAMVNKTVKKAESSIASLSSRTSVNRMRKLDAEGKRVMLERLYDMQNAIADAVRALEDALSDGGMNGIATDGMTASDADAPYIDEPMPEDAGAGGVR